MNTTGCMETGHGVNVAAVFFIGNYKGTKLLSPVSPRGVSAKMPSGINICDNCDHCSHCNCDCDNCLCDCSVCGD